MTKTAEAVELRNKILEYIIAFKTDHGGDSPSVADIARVTGIGKTTAFHHLRTLQVDGKIEIIKFTTRTIAIKVLCPPTVDGVTKRTGNVLDFCAGRAWIDGERVTVQVHQKFLRSVEELRRFAESLIAVSDHIEGGI